MNRLCIFLITLTLGLPFATFAHAAEAHQGDATQLQPTKVKKNRLPGNGPYVYINCVAMTPDGPLPVLPFRSTYSTAAELMANRRDLSQCEKRNDAPA